MNEFDFYIVCEQTSPDNMKSEILDFKKQQDGNVSYLVFRACLQDFGIRNRNGRLWNGRNMQQALQADHILELLQKRNLAGENGHPIPDTGKATMERIMTIDPEKVCHSILNFQWQGDQKVFADIMTIDDGVGPGSKFARSIMQGMEPSFSVRSVVPQRRNPDGTIDVTGVGRVITYDRVFLPSHKAAYRDVEIAVKKIVTKTSYETITESLTQEAYRKSDRAKYGFADDVVMESMTIENDASMISGNTSNGRIFIPLEKNVRKMIHSYMKDLNI